MLLDVRSQPAVSVTHVSQAVDAVTVARLIVDASPVVYASAVRKTRDTEMRKESINSLEADHSAAVHQLLPTLSNYSFLDCTLFFLCVFL